MQDLDIIVHCVHLTKINSKLAIYHANQWKFSLILCQIHFMKNKVYIFLLILFTFSSFLGSAQKDTTETMGGVYLSLEDYKAGRLTYDIDCNMEKQKIKLYNFLAKPYFDVWYKGEKIRLQKDKVYGFKNCHDETFRFYDFMEYQLLEDRNICIYVQEQMVLADKSGKDAFSYFFSTSPNGPLKPLTNSNLKDSYPENRIFHKLINEKINSVNIADYDSLQKMFKVNTLYLKSLKKK